MTSGHRAVGQRSTPVDVEVHGELKRSHKLPIGLGMRDRGGWKLEAAQQGVSKAYMTTVREWIKVWEKASRVCNGQ
jgi:hypothetical protein